MLKSFVNLAAAAAILVAAAPAAAQIQTVDPNQADAWQNAPAPAPEAEAPAAAEEYTPVEAQAPPSGSNEIYTAPPAAAATQGATGPREDVFSAAEGLFGRGARGLAGLLEDILRDQGQPTAYIAGREAGGAFMVGVRYGSGVMHHQVEGDRNVYWTGPSIGFDVGANASNTFVLVYNLHDTEQLYER